jgi:hypothetical protein
MIDKTAKKLTAVLAKVIESDIAQELSESARFLVHLAMERTMKVVGISAPVRRLVIGEEMYGKVQQYLNAPTPVLEPIPSPISEQTTIEGLNELPLSKPLPEEQATTTNGEPA